DQDCHPQTISVVRTRAEAFGFELIVGDVAQLQDHPVFGAVLQYTTTWGEVRDLRPLIEQVQAQQGLACVAADPLSLVLLTPPGELGADVVFGSSSVSVYPWATAVPMPPSLRLGMSTSGPCPGASSGYRWTAVAAGRCAWRCRPGSSTSAARKPTPISAPLRYCWPTSPDSTRYTTARRGCGPSPSGCTG